MGTRHGDRGPGHGRGPWRGGPDRNGPPPPPPSKAAHFKIERGDIKVDVKCADDEPLAVCADMTLKMIEAITPRP